MSDENVLYHSGAENITVTNLRLIYGDEVIPIGTLRGAGCCRSVSIFNDHPVAVIFGWKKWHLFVSRKGGEPVFDHTSRRFPEDVAKQIADAICKAIVLWEVENDPRKGLNLSKR